jgi:MarR family transcriptional regulator, organic hydroperoxide resistance regulator
MVRDTIRRMASPRQLLLDEQLCFALYATSRAMTARYRPMLSELGVTYPQYLVLLVLWERETASVRELGDALGMDYGTLSPILKRLERAGFVKRTRRAEDERVVDVSLTSTGRELERSACASVAALFDGPHGMTRAEADALRDRLTELRAVLEA